MEALMQLSQNTWPHIIKHGSVNWFKQTGQEKVGSLGGTGTTGHIAVGVNARGSNQYDSPVAVDLESPIRQSSEFPVYYANPFSWEEDVMHFESNNMPMRSEPAIETSPPQVAPTRISPSIRRARQPSEEGQSSHAQGNKKAKITKMPPPCFDKEYYEFKEKSDDKLISALKEVKAMKVHDEMEKYKEKYGINADIKAFKELEGFSIEELLKATKLFMADPALREAFLSLDPDESAVLIRTCMN